MISRRYSIYSIYRKLLHIHIILSLIEVVQVWVLLSICSMTLQFFICFEGLSGHGKLYFVHKFDSKMEFCIVLVVWLCGCVVVWLDRVTCNLYTNFIVKRCFVLVFRHYIRNGTVCLILLVILYNLFL